MTIEEAEYTFPIGKRVKYFPVYGEKEFEETEIRSSPWVLGDGGIVIRIKRGLRDGTNLLKRLNEGSLSMDDFVHLKRYKW